MLGQSTSSNFKGTSGTEAFLAEFDSTMTFTNGYLLDGQTIPVTDFMTCDYDLVNSYLFFAPSDPLTIFRHDGTNFASVYLTGETTTT